MNAVTFPAPIFVLEDWALVWVWPLIMAIIFGVFVRDRDLIPGGDTRAWPVRLFSSFAILGLLWIPSMIFGDALQRGAEAQNLAWPIGWRLAGLFAPMAVLVALATGVVVWRRRAG